MHGLTHSTPPQDAAETGLALGVTMIALDGGAADPARVGAKAAGFAALARRSVAPPGFALDSAACDALRAAAHNDRAIEQALDGALQAGVGALEPAMGRRFGAAGDLRLAVRISPVARLADAAPAVLSVGVDLSQPVAALSPEALAAERAFWRSLARARANGGGAAGAAFETAIEEAYETALDAQCSAAEITARLRAAAADHGMDAPSPIDQLRCAVLAIAAAWDGPAARRRRDAAQADPRAAVFVQVMADAAQPVSGRIALYDPKSGAKRIAGRLITGRIGEEALDGAAETALSDADDPMTAEAAATAAAVETALAAPHEVEFARFTRRQPPKSGGAAALWRINPWLAPTRAGAAARPGPSDAALAAVSFRPVRLSAQAAIRIAVEQADDGLIDRAEAVRRVPARSLEELLHESLAPDAPRNRIARGIPAAPGAAAGRLAFTSAEAEKLVQAGEAVILARIETEPEDIQGMHAAAAVLTTRGGLTSHAAVVARGLGAACVVGASDARLDIEAGTLTTADGRVFRSGDEVTVDGSSGDVLAGRAPTQQPELTGAFAKLMDWADSFRRLRVRANADTASEADAAQRLGVDGIGLCRTEHMFFDADRITVMREMILSETEWERRAAIGRLLPMQRADFALLFRIMGRTARSAAEAIDAPPVTIRLLDPPLNEFLPQSPEGLARLAQATGRSVEMVARRASDLREINPMLGKRGCRMGVSFPEIYEMQARAIFEATLDVEAADGRRQKPEIMVPLVSAVREFEVLRERIDAVAAAVREERSASFDYSVGIMIETPRAALRADALGAEAAFFSFGTNDLTQMTYGLSRDDAGRLMRDYVERGVFEADPFQSLDQDGVGELMRIAIERGRAANPDIAIGLCGEHGGDPTTIAFCEAAGFDYVSCSPYRAPIARLAAAQAALAEAAKTSAAEQPPAAETGRRARAKPARPSVAW